VDIRRINSFSQINGKEENIDVTKFATLLSNVKKKWAADGIQDGLTIFSGDTFSPSFQSSITRGKHMVTGHSFYAFSTIFIILTGGRDEGVEH
jgi:hypothetical protein